MSEPTHRFSQTPDNNEEVRIIDKGSKTASTIPAKPPNLIVAACVVTVFFFNHALGLLTGHFTDFGSLYLRPS